MAAVARELRRAHSDLDATLAAITESAVLNVAAAEDASITTVLQGKYVHSAAAAGDLGAKSRGSSVRVRAWNRRSSSEPFASTTWTLTCGGRASRPRPRA